MDGTRVPRPAEHTRPLTPPTARRSALPTGASSALLTLQRRAGNRAVTSVLTPATQARPAPPTRAALALLGGRPPAGTVDPVATAAAGLARGADMLADAGRSGGDDGVPVHDSAQSHRAAAAMGMHAYTFRGEIALGAGLDEPDGPGRSAVLAHELAHVRQTTGAATHAADPAAAEAAVQHGEEGVGADPEVPHGLFWLIPVAAAAYVLLRPNVANAPSPEDVASGNLQPSVSEAQVAGEALALFAVPGGIASGLARAGYGVIAAAGVSGAASSVAFRGVQDVGAGEFSGSRAYIIDAGTGAVIGVVVGGAVRIFGGAGGAAGSGQGPNLVHFTTPEAQAAILARSESGQLVGQLRGQSGIWALTDDALQQAPWQRAARATMSTSTAQAPVAVPAQAAGSFSRAVPVGPVSGWQYAMGVYRAPAGSISMATGQFTAAGRILPNIRGLIFPYGADAALWVSVAAFGLQGEESATADERGIRTLLPSFPPAVRPVIESNLSVRETTRTDGPFVVLPGIIGADAAVAGAQGSYDPVAEVCHGPEDNQSQQSEPDAGPAAVIYVAPFWDAGE